MDGVKSFPEAQFAWRVRKHGSSKLVEKMVDEENDGRLLISQSGDLYIVGVRSEDTWTYICVVSNPSVDNDITIEFALTVLEGEFSLNSITSNSPLLALLRSRKGNASSTPHQLYSNIPLDVTCSPFRQGGSYRLLPRLEVNNFDITFFQIFSKCKWQETKESVHRRILVWTSSHTTISDSKRQTSPRSYLWLL